MATQILLTIILLTWPPAVLCKVTTLGNLAVLEGRSVTVPCHYDPLYVHHVKYWCRGWMVDFCSSLARTDDAGSTPPGKDGVSIADDPSQQVFTVTMTELKEGDSGWYWCGVEVGGMWSTDDTTSLHIDVVHGMSVVNSMVSGEEGDSVSVECLYSDQHRESEKKWCRSGDWNSCLVADSSGSFTSSSVEISDDRMGAVTVTMRGLERKDTGWYWCAAGQQQVAVHVQVTPRSTTTMSVMTAQPTKPVQTPSSPSKAPNPPPVRGQDSHSHHFWDSPLMICGALFLLVTAVLAPWKIWAQCIDREKEAELLCRANQYAEGGVKYFHPLQGIQNLLAQSSQLC